MNDNVEFKQTGYYGFALEKKLSHNMMIGVSSGELNRPLLYVKKHNGDSYHIIEITGDIVKSLCFKNKY